MTFRPGGGKKRRDANESVIIHALEAVGVQVWQVSGRALPDLLCWFRGRPFVMEVKTAKGKYQPSQVGTPWPVVRTVDDALEVVTCRASSRTT